MGKRKNTWRPTGARATKAPGPGALAYYDGLVEVKLGAVKPMIALPMHPSNVYTIEELNANLADILHKTEEDCAALMGGKVRLNLVSKIENGRLRVDQGVIAGCAGGTYSNICEAAQILAGHGGGNGEYALSVYPSSQPTMMALMKNGALTGLMAGGANGAHGVLRPLLRRGGRAGERRPVDPAHDPQLPQPGGARSPAAGRSQGWR